MESICASGSLRKGTEGSGSSASFGKVRYVIDAAPRRGICSCIWLSNAHVNMDIMVSHFDGCTTNITNSLENHSKLSCTAGGGETKMDAYLLDKSSDRLQFNLSLIRQSDNVGGCSARPINSIDSGVLRSYGCEGQCSFLYSPRKC